MASPRLLDRDLWVFDLPLRLPGGLALGTRTTVIRLADGTLWVHSPGPLGDDGLAWLAAQGPPGAIVAPNLLHHLFLAETIRAFPGVPVHGPPGLAEKTGVECRVLAGDDRPWGDEIRWLAVEGAPTMGERAFLHARSRTLILTDLAFHYRTAPGIGTRLFLRANGALGRFGPSRLARFHYFEDRGRLRESVQRILEWDFDRVVVSHGEVVETAGREAMRRGFDWLLA